MLQGYKIYTRYKWTRLKDAKVWDLRYQSWDQSHKAKHAPIALTLLDCFSMATTKALKTQQDDASKWDAQLLLEWHHKEHKLRDIKHLKNKCSTKLKRSNT